MPKRAASIIYSSAFFTSAPTPPVLHSFPTRRSSDLHRRRQRAGADVHRGSSSAASARSTRLAAADGDCVGDRKSTRLNSSHGYISYAVFCLKKKKNKARNHTRYRPHSHLLFFLTYLL